MKSLAKKRTVSESSYTRPKKQRRTDFLRPDGERSSPSEEDGLRARWTATLSGLYEVGKDTALYLIGRTPNEMGRRKNQKQSQQSPNSSSSTSDTTLVEPAATCNGQPPSQNSNSIRGVDGPIPDGLPASMRHENMFGSSIAGASTPRQMSEPVLLSTPAMPTPMASRSIFSPSPALATFRAPTRTNSQITLGSYQNFSAVTSSPSPSRRDTPLQRPPHRRKGSMGPPPLPPFRNSQPFPTLSPAPSPVAPSFRASSEIELASLRRSSSVTSSRSSRPEGRPHILASQHRARVASERESDKKKMLDELLVIEQKRGYTSNAKDLESLITYKYLLAANADRTELDSSRPRHVSLLSALDDLKAPIRPSRMRRYSEQASTEFVRRALDQARKTFEAAPPIQPFHPTLDQLRLRLRNKNEEIDRRLHIPKRKPLPERLPEADESEVKALLKRSGVIAKYDREQVSAQDIRRLGPAQWLNDEIINFYGALVMGRAESSNKENNKSKSKFLNVHYFSTFFWSKLEKDGYEKARLAKWTKKFDIFTKDVLLIPVNHNNVHWTGAAINFRQKRVESYDSMNIYHKNVFKHLRLYLDAEHKNKKKAPFDFTGWVDYTSEDTPQQENGYDCGVFTCQFLQALSRGEESFNFTQKDIPYLRRRMIWEVAHARLRDDDP